MEMPKELSHEEIQRIIEAFGQAVKILYDERIRPAGLHPLRLYMENGRCITGPHGFLVTQAIHAAQSYELKDFLDLYSLCDELKKRCKTKEVKASSKEVMETLVDGSEKFVVDEKHKGLKVANSHGVSIYFPRGDVTVVYPRLDFAKATHWDEFIKTYQGK
jgi:hypothetical protein